MQQHCNVTANTTPNNAWQRYTQRQTTLGNGTHNAKQRLATPFPSSSSSFNMTDAAIASALSIGHLQSLDWKLGVAVASNHCASLNTPYVSLTLRVADPDNHITTHSFDLSLLEFKVCCGFGATWRWLFGEACTMR
jgi:hypothetical protein